MTRIILLGLALGWGGAVSAQVLDLQAPGNLEASAPLGCVELEAVTGAHTPADIYPGLRACLDRQDYARAVPLFTLAGVYGRIDQLRVTDKSAHQAVAVLRLQHLRDVPKAVAEAFQRQLATTTKDPEALAALCTRVRRLGPPDYHPRYMIQHGMGAFLGATADGPIRAGFDMAEAWKGLLESYLHCP